MNEERDWMDGKFKVGVAVVILLITGIIVYVSISTSQNSDAPPMKVESRAALLKEGTLKCSEQELKGVCTREYVPVTDAVVSLSPPYLLQQCGSDGKTYANKCLVCAARSTNPDLYIVKPGKFGCFTCHVEHAGKCNDHKEDH